MRKIEGEKPRARAQSRVIGMRSATTGVLLRKAERTKQRHIILPSPASREVLSPKTRRAALSASWDFSTPLITTNRAPTASIPALLNPESASVVFTSPTFQTSTRQKKTFVGEGDKRAQMHGGPPIRIYWPYIVAGHGGPESRRPNIDVRRARTCIFFG